MDLKLFSRRNRRRCESADGFDLNLDAWSLSDWMTVTMGKLGEAAKIVRKLNHYKNAKGDKEDLWQDLKQEIADTVICLDLLAQAAKIDLADAVEETFCKKSHEIGYPDPLEKSESEY